MRSRLRDMLIVRDGGMQARRQPYGSKTTALSQGWSRPLCGARLGGGAALRARPRGSWGMVSRQRRGAGFALGEVKEKVFYYIWWSAACRGERGEGSKLGRLRNKDEGPRPKEVFNYFSEFWEFKDSKFKSDSKFPIKLMEKKQREIPRNNLKYNHSIGQGLSNSVF